MVKINKKMSLVFILAITLFLAMSTLSAADSNSTSDTTTTNSLETSTTNTDHSNSQDNSNNIDHNSNSADSSISNKDTSTISTSTSHSSSDNTKTENSVKEVTTKTNTTTSSSTNQSKEVIQQNTTNTSQSNNVNNKTSLKQDSAIATDYSDLKDKVADESIDEINLSSKTTYNATSSITVNHVITINGNGATITGNNEYNIFTISTSGSLTLNNLTITNCSNTYGGVIYNEGNLTINNSTFTYNKATDGAVIYNDYNAKTDINSSKFNNNSVSNYGGVIYSYRYSDITINNSTFSNNSAINGGSIYLLGAQLNIKDSSFTRNKATNSGGVIYTYDGSEIIIRNSSFENNSASNEGGAIVNDYLSSSTYTNLSFKNNTATNGGAIYNYNHASTTITNSSYVNNTATDGGAISNINNSKIIIENSNFTKNNATNSGGAIYNYYYVDCIINYTNFTNCSSKTGGVIYNLENITSKINNSTFINNSATRRSGVIENNNTEINITDSLFLNSSSNSTGAITNYYKSIVKISNCNFTNNKGKAIFNSNTTLNLTESSFYNNKGTNGGAVYTSSENCTITNSIFSNNSATNGGAIYNIYSLNSLFFNLTFINNSADYGGTIYNYASETLIYNTTIYDSVATYGGSICDYTHSNTTILNCIINNSNAYNGGVIYNYNDTKTEIYNSIFENNTATNRGGVISNNNKWGYENVTIYNSTFTNNKAEYGGIISNSNYTNCIINNSKFIENFATYGGIIHYNNNNYTNCTVCNSQFIKNNATYGGVIYSIELTTQTKKEFNNCTFIENNATYGGVIYSNISVTKQSQYNVIDCNFINNTASEGGAIWKDGNMRINTSKFINNSAINYGGAIISYSNLTSNDSVFIGNNARYGGAIYNLERFNMTNITLINNSATEGGAIYSNDVTNSSNLNMIYYSNFIGNTATIGGAIYNYYSTSLNISGSTFTNNSAARGGAIDTSQNTYVTILDSVFTNNTSTNEGGAIYNDNILIVNNTVFEDNFGSKNETIYSIGSLSLNDNTIKMPDIEVLSNQTINIISPIIDRTLTSSDTVIFTLYGKNYPTTIDSNYLVSLNYTFEAVGETILTINYTTTYPNNDISQKINVVKSYNTEITINEIKNQKILNTINITGELKTEENIPLSNKTIIIMLNEEIISNDTLTNENGEYKFEYTLNTTGETIITVLFEGEYTYINSSNNVTFLVEKINTILTLEDINDTEGGEKININGMLVDEYNNKLNDQNILISINDEDIVSIKTDSEGKYSLNYTAHTEGINIITISFEGNDIYSSMSVSKKFNVYKIATKITLNSISIAYIDDNVSISGTLTDTNGFIIKEENILISINNETYTTTTNTNGAYNYIFKAETIGTYNITVTYNGNDKYTSSSNKTSIEVSLIDTKITIKPIEDCYVGDRVIITGDLTDKDNYILASTSIKIVINGSQGSTTTNNLGEYSYDYKINREGTYNITVTFEGNNKYKSSSTSITMNALLIQTIIELDSIENTKVDDTIRITGTLKDFRGNNITYTNVTISINQEKVSSRTTSKGFFSYYYTATTVGTYNITVTYEGNTSHASTSISTTCYVSQMPTKITLENISNTFLGDQITITGKLTNENNKTLNNTKISLLINQNKIALTTDSNGYFYYNYTTVTSGTNNITATFEGNNTHTSSSTSITFNVIKETITTKITMNSIVSSSYGSGTTISGRLNDINGTAIANATIILTINKENQTVTTNDTGYFRYYYSTDIVGTNNVTATFEGDRIYSSSNTSATFNVNKRTSYITVSYSNTSVANQILISGTLTWMEDHFITSQLITIKINDDEINITANQYGKYSLYYTITTAGTNRITATFNGNENYTSSTASITYYAPQTQTKIMFTVIENTTLGKTVTIRLDLSDLDYNSIKNVDIILSINGKNITLTTNSNGYVTYNYTTTIVGTNNVTATFEGNNNYLSSTASTTFVVSESKIATKITIEPISNSTIRTLVNITVKLTDINNNPISNMKINLIVDGSVTTIKTNENGTISQGFSTYKPGIHNVTATFEGNEYYSSSSTNTTYFLSDSATNIVVDQITDKNGYTVTLTAHITDSNGNPINTGQATFKLNGVTMKDNGTQIKVNVVNGLAQYNFTIPNYSAKEYKLTAVYGYLDTRLEDSTTLVILKSDPELKLTSITSDGTTGHITGMLLDEHGIGVDRETKVSVKINGKTILSTRIYEGVIDLEFDTSAYKNGIHNLTVIFGENGCYNTVTYEGVIAQNVKDTIVVNPVTGKNGDIVSFKAYIIDESGNSATNGSATFKLNGVTVKENGTQIKVNFVNGVAEYNFTIPDYSAKDYNLTAVASVGATRYEAQSVLTIEKTDTHVELDTITITQGSNATVTGIILDEHNNPITIDTKVSVKINGKTVSNTRVYDGLIDVPIDTSSYSKGNYTIDFVAGENGRYNKSTGSTTLMITN